MDYKFSTLTYLIIDENHLLISSMNQKFILYKQVNVKYNFDKQILYFENDGSNSDKNFLKKIKCTDLQTAEDIVEVLDLFKIGKLDNKNKLTPYNSINALLSYTIDKKRSVLYLYFEESLISISFYKGMSFKYNSDLKTINWFKDNIFIFETNSHSQKDIDVLNDIINKFDKEIRFKYVVLEKNKKIIIHFYDINEGFKYVKQKRLEGYDYSLQEINNDWAIIAPQSRIYPDPINSNIGLLTSIPEGKVLKLCLNVIDRHNKKMYFYSVRDRYRPDISLFDYTDHFFVDGEIIEIPYQSGKWNVLLY